MHLLNSYRHIFFIVILIIKFFIALPIYCDTIELSQEDKEYLKNREDLTMVVDPNWQPFDYIVDGKHMGMGAEYIGLISERLGINIRLIPTSNWSESLEIAKNGQCDIVTMLNKTQERDKYLDFTDPVFTSQIVIISRERIWLTKGLNELKGKRVAVGESYWLEENIRKDYPEIDLISLESPEDTLRMVSEGRAFATVLTLIEAMLIIQQKDFADLRIIGHTNYTNQLRLGVRKGDKELLSILQKSVLSFSEDENNEIFAKWASITIKKPFNYALLWNIAAITLAIIISILIWNTKLTKLNKSLQEMHRKLELKNRILEKLSTTDKLTNLFNRMKLDKTLKCHIDQVKRYNHPLSIILIDIDNFKSINDTYGHQKGDEVLKAISKILKESVREVDSVGRWGGEEFLVICPNTDIQGAMTLAENIRLIIHNKKFDNLNNLSASFGVSQLKSNDNETNIIQRADKALYKAKDSGRNRVEVVY